MLKRKIYMNYGLDASKIYREKINREIYNELINKYKIGCVSAYTWATMSKECNTDDYDLFYTYGYDIFYSKFYIIKNNTPLSDKELILIFDEGDLRYGGLKLGVRVYKVFHC